MKLRPIFLSLLLLVATFAVGEVRTMRLDYYHTGNAENEVFGMDRVVIEPAPWPGNPSQSIDETNMGNYLFEVRDQKSNRLLYSAVSALSTQNGRLRTKLNPCGARFRNRCASLRRMPL
jgi:hypothetical protein